jgi:hypothetical protein
MANIAHFSGRRELLAGSRQSDELRPGADTQLLKDAPQMMVNCSRADEQLGGGFAIGGTLAYHPHDLHFLPCQLIERIRVALPSSLACGA